jgi:hypothetical protein
MSRGRKERTPTQLAILAQAREKAKIVIAERAKLNVLHKTVVSVPVSEKDSPEPVSDPPPPPEPVSESENEDDEPRLTRREGGEMIQRTMSQRPSPKYQYINGMYIKIK